MLEVDDEAVESVRDRRAGRAAGGVLGAEHEVVDEELGAAAEQVGEGRVPLVGLEAVVLVDRDPGKLLTPPGQLVAPPGQLLLGLEQLEPRREPLLARSCPVLGHAGIIAERRPRWGAGAPRASRRRAPARSSARRSARASSGAAPPSGATRAGRARP